MTPSAANTRLSLRSGCFVVPESTAASHGQARLPLRRGRFVVPESTPAPRGWSRGESRCAPAVRALCRAAHARWQAPLRRGCLSVPESTAASRSWSRCERRFAPVVRGLCGRATLAVRVGRKWVRGGSATGPVRPNPSLERRPSTAGCLARQAGGQCRPVGQGVRPLRAPQLER